MMNQNQTNDHEDHPENNDGRSHDDEFFHDVNATPSDKPTETPSNESKKDKYLPSPSQIWLSIEDTWDAVRQFIRGYWSAPRHKAKWTEGAAVILTLLIAVAAFWSAWIFQEQLELMQDADRPWVTVEITANTDWVPGAIVGGPLAFDQGGHGNLTSKITMKNIGKSVATHVYIRSKALAIGLTDPLSIPLEYQKTLCSGLNTYAKNKSLPDSRYTIFPDDIQVEFDIRGVDAKQIEERPEFLTLKNGKPIALLLVGCVDYEYASSPKPHQTGFVYEISGKNPTHGIQTLMTFSVDQLNFQPYAFGGKYAY
jgi:hypothetical protein